MCRLNINEIYNIKSCNSLFANIWQPIYCLFQQQVHWLEEFQYNTLLIIKQQVETAELISYTAAEALTPHHCLLQQFIHRQGVGAANILALSVHRHTNYVKETLLWWSQSDCKLLAAQRSIISAWHTSQQELNTHTQKIWHQERLSY